MGLGLLVSKQIVRMFNGDLEFFSEHQKGSFFMFMMDLEHDRDELETKPQSAEKVCRESPRFNNIEEQCESPIVILNNLDIGQTFGDMM